jgi:hypothetical protein
MSFLLFILEVLTPSVAVFKVREKLRVSSLKSEVLAGASGSRCDPSYSGGRDQEDFSSKPAQTNSLRDPILNKLITKKCWRNGSRCRP